MHASPFTALIALLTACAGAPELDPTDSLATGETDPVDSDPVDSEPTVDSEQPLTGLWGRVVDASGAPLAGYRVLACTTLTCVVQDSDPQGRFSFAIEGPREVALKTLASPLNGVGVGLVPCAVSADGTYAAAPLYVPSLPALTPFDDEDSTLRTFAVGDDLELTLTPSELQPVPGERLTTLAARRLPPEWTPPYVGVDPADLIAVYTLHPFGASSAAPVQVSAPVDLPDDTPVWFRAVSYLDGTLYAPVPGRVRAGRAVTDEGVGIDKLSQVLITTTE